MVIAGSEFGVIAEAAVSSTGLIAEASLVDIGSYTLMLASTIITESYKMRFLVGITSSDFARTTEGTVYRTPERAARHTNSLMSNATSS